MNDKNIKFDICSVNIIFFIVRELSSEIELMLTTSVLPDKCKMVIEETVPKGKHENHHEGEREAFDSNYI